MVASGNPKARKSAPASASGVRFRGFRVFRVQGFRVSGSGF